MSISQPDIEARPTGKSEPITRSTLHDELVERLRVLILDGELEPDTRVPERELCERYGVSRTPLREALKVLASEGLLELLPNRGAIVSRLTFDVVDEMFPVIGALEALAGELACARITEEEIAEIRAMHYQMVLHQKRGERLAYFQLNQRIHEAIMEAAHNPTLVRQYRSLAGRIRRARYIANMSPERWQQAVDEHEEMLDALTARDGPRLAEILRRHLQNKCETVKKALALEAGRADGNASPAA